MITYIQNELDFDYESLPFLIRLFHQENINNALSRISNKVIREATDQFKPLLDILSLISDDIYMSVKLDNHYSPLLFSKNEDRLPLAYAFWSTRFYSETMLEVEARRKLFFSFIVDVYNTENDSSKPPYLTDSDFFAWISISDIPNEDKYRITHCYLQFEACYSYLYQLMEQAGNIIRSYYDQLQPFVDTLLETINKGVNNEQSEFLSSLANVKLEENDEVIIYPSLSLSAMIFFSDFMDHNIVVLGFVLSELWQNNAIDWHKNLRIVELLKALSDNTKFSILIKIKDNKLYSSQLASMLNLSGATVSHHMSGLHILRLVNIEKRGNRVYYSLNKEVLASYLKELQSLLIN